MSKFDKLLQRILQLDKGLRFNEVRKVLEAYGYTKPTDILCMHLAAAAVIALFGKKIVCR